MNNSTNKIHMYYTIRKEFLLLVMFKSEFSRVNSNWSIEKITILFVRLNSKELHDILEKTLLLLDDENNDFYIHVDKKVKNFNFDYYKRLVKYSNIYFLKKRRNIFWGSHRIIWTELDLFKEAYKNHYEYYHLLSGCDMPIKNKKEIKEFFENHQDTEFININKISDSNIYDDRINLFKYYYLLKSSRIDSYFRRLQKLFHIDIRINMRLPLVLNG